MNPRGHRHLPVATTTRIQTSRCTMGLDTPKRTSLCRRPAYYTIALSKEHRPRRLPVREPIPDRLRQSVQLKVGIDRDKLLSQSLRRMLLSTILDIFDRRLMGQVAPWKGSVLIRCPTLGRKMLAQHGSVDYFERSVDCPPPPPPSNNSLNAGFPIKSAPTLTFAVGVSRKLLRYPPTY